MLVAATAAESAQMDTESRPIVPEIPACQLYVSSRVPRAKSLGGSSKRGELNRGLRFHPVNQPFEHQHAVPAADHLRMHGQSENAVRHLALHVGEIVAPDL